MHHVLCEPLFKEVLYVCFRLNENKLSINKRCPCRHLASNTQSYLEQHITELCKQYMLGIFYHNYFYFVLVSEEESF